MRDSESAPNLINTLFQQRGFGDIIFRIVAQNNRITWEIQLNPQIADAVKRAILSFYPHADITQEDPESTEELSPDEQWVTDHVKEFSDFAREKYSVQGRAPL